VGSVAAFPSIADPRRLKKAERSELLEIHSQYRKVSNEYLRRQILENNRIDILATEVLGYELKPFHFSMQRFQFEHPQTLQLAPRGFGKSTICTVTKCIHLLLKNPNLRILIASKTSTNAEGFLKAIKTQFEENERLAEIFGPYYDPKSGKKWDNKEIEVLPRTAKDKEGSISCVGVLGTIVSKHYDVIFSDDLIDEDNSRTEYMREKIQTWYYKVLDPTLEPPDPKVEHRGEHHHLGTRYHFDDIWGHFIANQLKEHHQVIKALNEQGRSPWPEKFPPTWLLKKRKNSGLLIFNSQYQNDTEAMKGEIFQYDHCQPIDDKDIPEDLKIFMGVDLAISKDEQNDHFAIVVIGIDSSKNIYVLDHYDGQLRFKAQTLKIKKYYRKWDPIRCAIESNAYQMAQTDVLKDEEIDLRVKPIQQDKDKISRAWKLSAKFEDKRMFFKKTGKSVLLIEQLVLFPSARKDLFDALDLAVRASKIRKRRKRDAEPGLIG
jgi:phage terminase large subunit-like protein